MKALLTSVLFLFFIGTGLQAQEYTSAIGARLGSPLAASYKYFMDEYAAIEGYVGIRPYSFGGFFSLSGAYLRHQKIIDVQGLQWYYGGGASIYFWNFTSRTNFLDNDLSNTTFGVQGYIGLDYTLGRAPISITADWIPTFFFGGTRPVNSFGAGFGSVGVRYILSN